MNPEIREKYNSLFSEKNYKKFIENIQSETDNRLDFTISETPLFLTKELTVELINAGNSILSEIGEKEFLQQITEIGNTGNGHDSQPELVG